MESGQRCVARLASCQSLKMPSNVKTALMETTQQMERGGTLTLGSKDARGAREATDLCVRGRCIPSRQVRDDCKHTPKG